MDSIPSFTTSAGPIAVLRVSEAIRISALEWQVFQIVLDALDPELSPLEHGRGPFRQQFFVHPSSRAGLLTQLEWRPSADTSKRAGACLSRYRLRGRRHSVAPQKVGFQ